MRLLRFAARALCADLLLQETIWVEGIGLNASLGRSLATYPYFWEEFSSYVGLLQEVAIV